MPWMPELFSTPVLERILEQRRRERVLAVPFFDGLHDRARPRRSSGRSPGSPSSITRCAGASRARPRSSASSPTPTTWMAERNVTVEDVNFFLTPAARRRGGRRCISTATTDASRCRWPSPRTATEDARIVELRIYFSTWPLTGGHANRPPLLQPDPDLREPDVVGEYQRALAAGDVEAVLAAFEPDAYGARAGRRRLRPPRHGRAPRALRAVLLQRRRHPAGALRASPTTAAAARWSTTSSPGAGPSCRPRRASPSTSAATAASSPPPASTTTSTRPCAGTV